jgi:predicted ArsR family transcriptional regulator
MATKSSPSETRSAGKGAPAGGRVARRVTTKKDRLVRLLKASAGREIAALRRELGWLPHTTRAALTRLRKAGYAIEKLPSQNNGASRYRIAGEPAEPTP